MNFVPGIPVPIEGIEKQLGLLWDQNDEGKNRASLINFVVYNEKSGSLEANSTMIRNIAGEHAMRAILVEAAPEARDSSAEAWINMHCYPRGSQGGAVCSEQIAFRLAGKAARSLPSVVFSHLDSDLPLALWWQADFQPPVLGRLWRWVDRLLFDSRYWKNPGSQFANLSDIIGMSDARIIPCDLNWARSLPVRQAVASLFDAPGALEEIPRLDRLELTHAPGFRTTALLLAGWLAERLGWRLTSAERKEFANSSGGTLTFSLSEEEGHSISLLRLASGRASFEVIRGPHSDCYASSLTGVGNTRLERMVRAPREETREILLSELGRGGKHSFYCAAIQAMGRLWS